MKIYFKHSTRCPISAAAKMEMDSFLEHDTGKIPFELIDIISNRERSNEIEEKYGIEHESPQVILVDDNDNVLWNASHRRVTEERLKKAIAEAGSGAGNG
jgi:bacillithiol system protein YtxJ